MQVTLLKNNDLNGIIKVEVVASDYADAVKKELKHLGNTRQIPGFRKGHVPASQLQRLFGKEVKSHVLNEEVYKAVIEYIRENKIDILGEPLPVDVKAINLDDQDYTFEYEVGFAPALDFEVNKDITMPYYTIAVSDEMVKEQDASLCERFGSRQPIEAVEGKALVKGAIMQLDEEGNVVTTEDAIQVVDGIVAPFLFTDKDQAALFEGKKVGDKVTFNPSATCNGNAVELASMLHIDKEKAAEVKGNFEMAISEIIGNIPAQHGEEFYKEVFPGNAEITTEEQYFEELRKMIAAQLEPNSEYMFQRDARKILVEKFGNFELPAEFLKKWLVARNEELTPEKADTEYTTMEPAIKWELISNKIAEKLDIKVEEADMISFAKGIAYQQFMQYGMTNMDDATLTEYAKRILSDKNYARRIHQDVFERKLFNSVRALVNVDEKTVSLDEFKALANPGAESAE